MANIVVEIARRDGRDYITDWDINIALGAHPVEEVRLAVLEVLANVAGAGAEDASCCAFVAWKGKHEPVEEEHFRCE